MSIEEIILTNNIDIYKEKSIPIKIFLLNEILNNSNIKKYQFCIDYFILNNDNNFIDSIENKNICLILYNCLNDVLISDYVNDNRIIIAKSINIFNQDYKYVNNRILLSNTNLEFDNNFIYNKLQLLNKDNLLQSIYILDDIFIYINKDSPKLIKIYNKINEIINISKNELINRSRYIETLLNKIYLLVLNKNIDDDIILEKDELINALTIIAIIRNKIYELINNDNSLDENINLLFKNENEKILNILNIFDKTIENNDNIDKYKLHIINICNIYNDIQKYNIEGIDLIEFIENLFIEINQIKQIIESLQNDNTDLYIEELIDIIILINNDDRILLKFIKVFIQFINDIKNNPFIKNFNDSYNDTININEKKYLKRELDTINNMLSPEYFEYLYLIINVIINKKNSENKISELNKHKQSLIENVLNNSEYDIENTNDLIIELDNDITNIENKVELLNKQIDSYLKKII